MRVATGQKVRFVNDLDFYPHFIVRAGMTGTVVGVSRGGPQSYTYVLLDEKLDGCEHWDNQVALDGESGYDSAEELQLVT